MIKIKPFLIATLLLTGFALPATAQIGEARSNLSVGVNGGVNLNSVSFTPSIKLFCHDLRCTSRIECITKGLGPIV